jgi:hypothetical protein
MHPDERRIRSGDIAVNERDRLRSVASIREDDRVELPDAGGKDCPGKTTDATDRGGLPLDGVRATTRSEASARSFLLAGGRAAP